MKQRYLLLASNDPALLQSRVERTAMALGHEPHFRSDRFALFGEGVSWLEFPGGCIVGTLFHRHGPARPIERLALDEADAIAMGGMTHLLARYWGGYLALFRSGDHLVAMRDPSAALPCYFVSQSGWWAFAADAELLAAAELLAPAIDVAGLARCLSASNVPTSTTALTGISELLAGFSLALTNLPDPQRPCWSPWDYAGGPSLAPDAADRLQRIAAHCVAGWAAAGGKLLVSVSGGLDSSIVACGLAAAGADASYITMYDDDPAGDERDYARTLCTHLGLQLVECRYELDQVDLLEPMATHLPRPTDRSHAMPYERAHLAVANAMGASAFMTGNGGDSLFGYSQSATAAADRYLVEGLGSGVLATLLDISRQTGCSLLSAFIAAARRTHGPRAYRCLPDTSLLHPDVGEAVAHAPDHHWLEAPADALPGKAAHVAAILRMQPCLEAGRGRFKPVLNPLLSQPLIEYCLGIPTWEWRTGGRDRALARRAFAKKLPPEIVKRRVKGGPDGFAARLLNHFSGQIRDLLLSGYLVDERIVDPLAVEEILKGDHRIGGEQRARLLELVAAEAWAASWRKAN